MTLKLKITSSTAQDDQVPQFFLVLFFLISPQTIWSFVHCPLSSIPATTSINRDFTVSGSYYQSNFLTWSPCLWGPVSTAVLIPTPTTPTQISFLPGFPSAHMELISPLIPCIPWYCHTISHILLVSSLHTSIFLSTVQSPVCRKASVTLTYQQQGLPQNTSSIILLNWTHKLYCEIQLFT